MRIAFVTPEYVTESNFFGGLANYLHRVSLSLLQLGHQPIVIVASDKNETFIQDGIEIHRVFIPSRKIGIRLLNILTVGCIHFISLSWKLNNEVKRVHKREPLSIVQYAHLSGIGLFRPKTICSVVRLSSYTPLARQHGWYSDAPFLASQQEFMEKWAMQRADGIFGPCHLTAKVASEDIKRPVKVIETPFTLDVSKLDEKPYRDLLEGKDYLLFFGSITALKGVDMIAEIIPNLLSNYPNLYFVFLGKDKGYQGKPMMKYVWDKAGSHRERILYMGIMYHRQLYPIINHAFAVILPSRVENLPNACIEAMAHKRIVVGTRGTSFEQLIVDGKSGFLCENYNPTSLLEKIEQVLDLTDIQREEIGKKAWERIYELRPEKVVNELVDFYKQIISKKKHF